MVTLGGIQQQNKNPEIPTHNQSVPINSYSLWISPTFINTGPVCMTWQPSAFPTSVSSLAFILEDCDWKRGEEYAEELNGMRLFRVREKKGYTRGWSVQEEKKKRKQEEGRMIQTWCWVKVMTNWFWDNDRSIKVSKCQSPVAGKEVGRS